MNAEIWNRWTYFITVIRHKIVKQLLINFVRNVTKFKDFEKLKENNCDTLPVIYLVLSALGIATGYWLDGRGIGVLVPVGKKFFSSLLYPQRFWGRLSLRSDRYPSYFSEGVKRPGREVDHSPPTSVEVKKKAGLYIHFPIHLHGLVLNYLSIATTSSFLPYIYIQGKCNP
jgi:hypothetical protein